MTTITTPSGAPVEGVRIIDMPDLGTVTDSSIVVGDLAGSGTFRATALRDYITAGIVGGPDPTQPPLGAVTDASKFFGDKSGSGTFTAPDVANYVLTKIPPVTPGGGYSDVANVMDYGADSSGVADSTAAFRAAVATGKTVYIPARSAGIYRINGAITITQPGQIIYGDGKGRTVIRVDSAFNLSAQGVFIVNAFVPGPQFRDFQVNFIQPDTASRGGLTAYPPAFYAQNEARGTWRGIKVNAAMICIDLRQNAGGSSIIDCELCAFDKHVAIDGSLDSITIANTRFENDLLTVNQSVIYHEAATTGISTGRCDDLHVLGCLFICGTHINSFTGTGSNPGATFGEITNCDFDSFLGMAIHNGYFNMSGCTFTEGTVGGVSATGAVVLGGGTLNMTGCWINSTIALPNGSIIMAPENASIGCMLNISACRFDIAGNSFFLQLLNTVSGYCQAIVSGSAINPDPNALTSRNCVQVGSGCQLTFTGNRFGGRISSTGVAVALATDAAHVIVGNSFANWANSFPIPYNSIVYASNSDNSGEVGRYLSATVNAVNLASTTSTNILTLTLSPGDWDVRGGVDFVPSGGTSTSSVLAGLSLTGSFLAGRGAYQSILTNPGAGQFNSITAGILRVQATVTTNVYLVVQANFTGGTELANGFIGARRMAHA